MASLGEVISLVKAAIEELDSAAVQMIRAQEDAQQAFQMLEQAGSGSGRPEMSQSAADMDVVAAKIGKMSRQFASAAGSLTSYINVIAPNSGLTRNLTESMPTGQQLVDQKVGNGSRSSRLLGRVHSVKNADDGLQNGKKMFDAIGDALQPGVVAPTPKGPVIRSAGPEGAEAGGVLMAALTLAIVGVKAVEVFKQRRRKDSRTSRS